MARNSTRWLRGGTLSCAHALLIATVLVVPVMAVSASIAFLIGFLYEVDNISRTSIYAQADVGLARVMKTMLWTPIFENSLVAVTILMISGWTARSRWEKPFAIGVIFSVLHAVLANDLRPLSVLPAFVVIAFLIEGTDSTKLKLCGFIASITFHSLSNSLILIPFLRAMVLD